MIDHREESRVAVKDEVTVRVLGKPDICTRGRVLNVSRWGLCLRVAERIPAGARVNVAWHDHFLVGTIRYARGGNAEQTLGVELMTCSRWSQAMPEPKAPAGPA